MIPRDSPIKWPRRIAHRGASALAPENTLAALSLAARLGASWVEFDVALTQDDRVVVIHDETVNRTSNAKGCVRDLSWEKLQLLDVGSWFAPAFSKERIPLLSQWMALADRLSLHLNMEIKSREADAFLLVKGIALTLEKQGFEHSLLFSSAEPKVLEALEKSLPHYPRGLIAKRWNRQVYALCERYACVSVHLNAAFMTQRMVEEIQGKGLRVLVWTVNDPSFQDQLDKLGVDGIFSDVVWHSP